MILRSISKPKFWIFSVLTSLLTTSTLFFSSFAFAQEIPLLDPAAVYKNCLGPTVPPPSALLNSCRQNLPHEAAYSDCLDHALTLPSPDPFKIICQNTYLNSVLSDYLNQCLISHPDNATSCQNYYSQASNFFNCLTTSKNPLACDKVYGLKSIPSVRDAGIPSGAIPGVNPLRSSVGTLIANALQIVFTFAALAVLIYLVIGAFRWITSGGDKEAIGKARGTITAALAGLTILALAFFITVLFGEIVGINILSNLTIPTLNQTPIPFGSP